MDKEALTANFYSLTEQQSLWKNVDNIMKQYYDSDFHKIMDSLEFISMHFKMQHMKTYLLHYHDKCESPAELLLYNAIVEEIGIAPSVQLPWKCCNRKTYRLDFAYPAIIAPFLFNIEVDGVIYHNCRIQKDKWRDEALKMDNVIVIRITGKFIYKDPNAAAREVIEKMQSFNNRLKKEYIDENEGIS